MTRGSDSLSDCNTHYVMSVAATSLFPLETSPSAVGLTFAIRAVSAFPDLCPETARPESPIPAFWPSIKMGISVRFRLHSEAHRHALS